MCFKIFNNCIKKNVFVLVNLLCKILVLIDEEDQIIKYMFMQNFYKKLLSLRYLLVRIFNKDKYPFTLHTHEKVLIIFIRICIVILKRINILQ